MAVPRATCFTIYNGTELIESPYESPCWGIADTDTFCCAKGDQCTQDSICHFTHDMGGYYIGGCTDSTFNDPACSKHCDSFPTQGIIYNTSTNLWACCYKDVDSGLDCTHPGNQTFQAIAPVSLSAAPTYGATQSSSTQITLNASNSRATLSSSFPISSTIPTPSTSTTLTPAASTSLITITASSTSTTPTLTPSDVLSTSAKAGVGVGAPLGTLALISAIIYFLRRRRSMDIIQNLPKSDGIEQAPPQLPPGGQVITIELGAEQSDYELGGQARSELDTRAEKVQFEAVR